MPAADATSQPPGQSNDEASARQPMYEDKRKALDLLDRCQRDARSNAARQPRDRADLYNLKLYKGGEANHWIVWDNNAGTYVERPTTGEGGIPKWFHRATTNHFANKIDGVAAILNQSQPAKNWYATKEDDESRAAAEVCEMADPVLLDEIDYPHNLRPRLNKIVGLTNLAALVVTYDNDPKWGQDTLPILQCASCQQYVHPMDAPNEDDMCPDCGGGLDWATHPQTNAPLGVPYPKGKLSAEFLSSFEVSLPKSGGTAHEDHLPWVATHQRWSTEDAISRWPQLKELLDARSTIRTSGAKSTHQSYADQMRDLSAPVTATGDHVGGASSPSGPVIWRLWHDPIDDTDFYFPQGVFLTVLEGQEDEAGVLDFSPLPFKDDAGEPFKNVLIRQFVAGPGSQFGKPPADDLAPLQVQLNLALSLAFLILMHHGSPRTFLPTTVTLQDDLSGMPGKVHRFSTLRPGDKPIVEPGAGFPEGLKWFLEFIIKAFDDISKLNAVLMGQRPAGDPTLGEVEILQERGFAAFQEPLEQLVAFERRLSLKLLHIVRECGWGERFAEIVGDDGEWKLRAFRGADLDGHVTVDIDLATAWPKSAMLTNMRVSKAFELGILNPQDPEVAEEYLKTNDLLQFKKSTDADEGQVNRQLDTWKHAQTPQEIAPPEDWWRLDYHLFRKTQFLKSELFEQMRQEQPEIAQAILAHVQQLRAMQQQAQMEQAAAAGGGPAPAESPKGAGGALEHAIQSGALRPKGQPPAKGAAGVLTHAVAAGALRPRGPKASRGALAKALDAKALRPGGPANASAVPRRHTPSAAGAARVTAQQINAPTTPGAAS
jgi:hypothetical protein